MTWGASKCYFPRRAVSHTQNTVKPTCQPVRILARGTGRMNQKQIAANLLLPDMTPSERAKLAAEAVKDARERTFEMVADLTDDELMGHHTPVTNPFLWEIGHVAWFQERWVLRHAHGESPLFKDADTLYDSAAVPHDSRWSLPLYRREETLRYLTLTRDRSLEKLAESPDETTLYFVLLALFHEDMHTEAFSYMRQTLSFTAPQLFGGAKEKASPPPGETLQRKDVRLPGGTFHLGAGKDLPFAFDNEQWAHPITCQPFSIATTAVTQEEYLEFVEEGGYRRRELWDDEGWSWREENPANHPIYWKKDSNGEWLRRDFDQWLPLVPDHPIMNVSWHEAQAFCRFARRRLPTELEWEVAASAELSKDQSSLTGCKRLHPWGDTPPTEDRAHLNWNRMRPVSVAAFPAGDSPAGCRQMTGNVWEWTSSTFLPYAGFTAGPYKEFSEPWFHTRKVLRGGSFATRCRLLRNTCRNYFPPDRQDVWAGFRTCAVE